MSTFDESQKSKKTFKSVTNENIKNAKLEKPKPVTKAIVEINDKPVKKDGDVKIDGEIVDLRHRSICMSVGFRDHRGFIGDQDGQGREEARHQG